MFIFLHGCSEIVHSINSNEDVCLLVVFYVTDVCAIRNVFVTIECLEIGGAYEPKAAQGPIFTELQSRGEGVKKHLLALVGVNRTRVEIYAILFPSAVFLFEC